MGQGLGWGRIAMARSCDGSCSIGHVTMCLVTMDGMTRTDTDRLAWGELKRSVCRERVKG